jgi:hypothetical protein
MTSLLMEPATGLIVPWPMFRAPFTALDSNAAITPRFAVAWFAFPLFKRTLEQNGTTAAARAGMRRLGEGKPPREQI